MELRGADVHIRPLRGDDAAAMADLRVRNKEFFKPYFPTMPSWAFTEEGQRADILRNAESARDDTAYVFGVFLNADGSLIGGVGLRNVARAAWQNATLGYYISEEESGKGFATQAVNLVLSFAFERAGLHRVQAGTLRDNRGSMRVLEKCGFRHEGMSPRYLKLDGVWQDHEIFAITIEDWKERSRGS